MAQVAPIAQLHCVLATYAAVTGHIAFSWLLPVAIRK